MCICMYGCIADYRCLDVWIPMYVCMNRYLYADSLLSLQVDRYLLGGGVYVYVQLYAITGVGSTGEKT